MSSDRLKGRTCRWCGIAKAVTGDVEKALLALYADPYADREMPEAIAAIVGEELAEEWALLEGSAPAQSWGKHRRNHLGMLREAGGLDPMTLENLTGQRQTAAAASRRARPKHPKGWEPGIDTAKRTLTCVTPLNADPQWDGVLQELGLDAEVWEVVPDPQTGLPQVEVRSWETLSRDHGVVKLMYHKAKVRKRQADRVDLDELIAVVAKRRPLKNARTFRELTDEDRVEVVNDEHGQWMVVVLADWQAGKGTRGGSRRLARRLRRLRDEVLQRAAWLRRAGETIDGLVVMLAGDMVEACDGHYAMQVFEVDLDGRGQTKFVRRALVELLDAWAPVFTRIVVGTAPGNHGEKRKDGKANTTWADNVDIEVVEQAAEVLAANPERYGHISFRYPRPDELTVTLEVAGTRLGAAHGHQFMGKTRTGHSGIQGKVLGWADRMASRRHEIGDVDVLLTGHYHHHQEYRDGKLDPAQPGKVVTWHWMQAPALDGGSPWFEQSGGGWTDAGTLTFCVAGGKVLHKHIIAADDEAWPVDLDDPRPDAKYDDGPVLEWPSAA